jgi:sulfur relay (sulfurtransferase) complex TusBCD TusD component (DsrE family)
MGTGSTTPLYNHKIGETIMANFLFVLRSNDNEKATRCFQFAKIAHSKEHTVNIFLIDSGVDWAIKGKDGSTKTITGDCVNDYLPYLIEKEIPTGVCTPCAKNRDLDEANFNSNMVLDGGPHLIDMAAEAKIFNF